jgi:hypothetical protein
MSDDNSIPLPLAQTWVNTWRGEEGTYNKNNEVHGFLIPAKDLQEALDEMDGQVGDKFVRAYLGVDPTTQTEKLIIVGTKPEVNKTGTVYRDLIDGYDGNVGGKILDFVKPCPPKCDDKSPLN